MGQLHYWWKLLKRSVVYVCDENINDCVQSLPIKEVRCQRKVVVTIATSIGVDQVRYTP